MCAAMWMKLEDIMPNKISLIQKDIYNCIILGIYSNEIDKDKK